MVKILTKINVSGFSYSEGSGQESKLNDHGYTGRSIGIFSLCAIKYSLIRFKIWKFFQQGFEVWVIPRFEQIELIEFPHLDVWTIPDLC